jgi:small ligand-binding sensory domain FIST
MHYGAALSEHPMAVTAAAEVATRVSAELGSAPDVALLFATSAHRDELGAIGAVVRDRLGPRILAGASAVSVVGGPLEIEERPAVSLWAARVGVVDPLRLTATRLDDGSTFDGIDIENPAGGHTLVVVPDPFSFPISELVDELARESPDLTVIGGLASAAHRPGDNRLLLDDEVFDDGAIGLLLRGPARVTTVVSQGCRPVGRPLVVTRSEGNLILELAGRPAFTRLAELVGSLSEADRQLASRGLHIGRVIDEHRTEFGRGDFLIRGVLGADTESGAVAIGDVVPVGSTVQFQVRDAESADEDLRELMAGEHADGALLFTCNGRGSHLFSAPHHDAGLVSAILAGAPLGGMFCAGEIGPVGGRSFVHGFTASLALFHDD